MGIYLGTTILSAGYFVGADLSVPTLTTKNSTMPPFISHSISETVREMDSLTNTINDINNNFLVVNTIHELVSFYQTGFKLLKKNFNHKKSEELALAMGIMTSRYPSIIDYNPENPPTTTAEKILAERMAKSAEAESVYSSTTAGAGVSSKIIGPHTAALARDSGATEKKSR
jgi:hypothetical protein